MVRTQRLKFINWLAALLFPLLLAVGSLLGAVSTTNAQTAGQRDCDDNAVIRCGSLTLSELKQDYRANQAGNVQAIFREFGINSESDLNGMVEGRVTGNNEVYVGNRLVATNALTAGRHDMPGSTPIAGGAAYMRPPSTSFVNPDGSLHAFVKMRDNRFVFAVISSCGNPVKANPTQPPPKPEPERSNFTIDKEVRLAGNSNWVETVSVEPGQRVEFRVVIRNTGNTNLTSVRFRDALPSQLDFVSGSFTVDDMNSAGDYFGAGRSIGAIAPNMSVVIRFTATVDGTANCKAQRLKNTALAKPAELPEKSDSAHVRIVCPEGGVGGPEPAPPVVEERIVERTVVQEVQVERPQPEPAPKFLPDTGPAGAVAGIFASFTAGGALAHSIVQALARRFGL